MYTSLDASLKSSSAPSYSLNLFTVCNCRTSSMESVSLLHCCTRMLCPGPSTQQVLSTQLFSLASRWAHLLSKALKDTWKACSQVNSLRLCTNTSSHSPAVLLSRCACIPSYLQVLSYSEHADNVFGTCFKIWNERLCTKTSKPREKQSRRRRLRQRVNLGL